jgi:hypothetical protein
MPTLAHILTTAVEHGSSPVTYPIVPEHGMNPFVYFMHNAIKADIFLSN